jgi:hypothetical protein
VTEGAGEVGERENLDSFMNVSLLIICFPAFVFLFLPASGRDTDSGSEGGNLYGGDDNSFRQSKNAKESAIPVEPRQSPNLILSA